MEGRAEVTTAPVSEADWERLWAPYDEPLYRKVLALVRPDDIILDIGAGDLRLANRLACRASHVYAVEIDPALITETPRPANLDVICADAYHYPFPSGITLAVLLMRHCRHFRLLADKLLEAGCHYLITNARWRMDMEVIDLTAPRTPFVDVMMGWYACWCGATGFVPGPPETLTPHTASTINEVYGCPRCCN